MGGHDSHHYWVPVDRSAPNNAHSFALRLIGRDKHVLELGCAAGHVTQALVEQGCTVVGVEQDEQAARSAALIADDVFVTDLFDATNLTKAIGDRDFDVVYAGDVLEHLPDPAGVLRAAVAAVRPGGSVVISVPNVAHIDVRLALLTGRFTYRDWGLLDRTHLRFFTRDSLIDLLDEAGLRMVELLRVVRPPFETELQVSRQDVPEAAVLFALADPEAEVYQFVLRAVPLEDVDGPDDVANEIDALDHALAAERAKRLSLELALLQARDELRDLKDQSVELDALKRTKTFRWTAGLRHLYRIFRGSA